VHHIRRAHNRHRAHRRPDQRSQLRLVAGTGDFSAQTSPNPQTARQRAPARVPMHYHIYKVVVVSRPPGWLASGRQSEQEHPPKIPGRKIFLRWCRPRSTPVWGGRRCIYPSVGGQWQFIAQCPSKPVPVCGCRWEGSVAVIWKKFLPARDPGRVLHQRAGEGERAPEREPRARRKGQLKRVLGPIPQRQTRRRFRFEVRIDLRQWP
jgi:hypothetical protein